jgi:hypothetical protein
MPPTVPKNSIYLKTSSCLHEDTFCANSQKIYYRNCVKNPPNAGEKKVQKFSTQSLDFEGLMVFFC